MAKLSDNLRERWDRITPRERTMVIALAGTAVFLIGYFVATTISGGLDTIDRKNDKTREALAALHEYRLRQAQGAESERPQVPIGNQPVELESFLEKVAKDVGVEVPGYSPRPETEVGRFTEVATKFDVRGVTILQLKDLLQAIETQKQGRVVITDLTVKRQFREQEKLDIELTVATYYEKGAEGDADGDEREKGEEG